MFIEKIVLSNFRCFGPVASSIELAPGLTTFVGVNGAGKTAVLQALQRMFGITGDQRLLRRQDFHIPATEAAPALSRTLAIEAILAFPELDAPGAGAGAVPEFFQQMAADAAGTLKCRLRLVPVRGASGERCRRDHAILRLISSSFPRSALSIHLSDRKAKRGTILPRCA